MNVSYVNACGLKSKLIFPEFESFLIAYQIIGIGKTKLCEDDIISFPGYTFLSKHRKTFVRKSGGLCIFIKKEILPYVEIVDVDSELVMVLKIKNSICTRNEDLNIILAFVYLPPEGSDYSSNDSMTEIERELLPIIENN